VAQGEEEGRTPAGQSDQPGKASQAKVGSGSGKKATEDPKIFIFSRELSEVHLLLDALSANPNTTLAALIAKAPPAEPPTGLPADWIEQICQISWPPEGSAVDQSKQASLLIKAKDYLNRLSKPASGSTIAFTTLVTQEDDPREALRRSDGPAPDIDDTPSRSSLACTAYPDLIPKARTFRSAMRLMALFLFAWLIVTCFLSWYVAFGNAALGEYAAAEAALQVAQKRVDDAEAAEDDPIVSAAPTGGAKPEAAASPVSAGGAKREPPPPARGAAPAATPATRATAAAAAPAAVIASPAPAPALIPAVTEKPSRASALSGSEVGYCNRAKLLGYKMVADGEPLPLYDNIGQMQACQARDRAQANIDRVKRRLSRWLWPLGGGPKEPKAEADDSAAAVSAEPRTKAGVKTDAKPAAVAIDPYADVPSAAASLANIMGSAMLPVIYGILGAGAAIIRSLSRKIKNNTLNPRDLMLSLQQLALGAVVGACIGLFIAQPDADGGDASLMGPVALSGSAISFVAGFGVEAVFQALEALIARIFNVAPPARPEGPGAA
jgi:hypothetical protein